jgi:hypothetical protein
MKQEHAACLSLRCSTLVVVAPQGAVETQARGTDGDGLEDRRERSMMARTTWHQWPGKHMPAAWDGTCVRVPGHILHCKSQTGYVGVPHQPDQTKGNR